MSEIEEKLGTTEALKSKIADTSRKIVEAKEFEKQIEAKKTQLAELEAQLRSKKADLPKAFNVPELLNDIFNEAQLVGLELSNVAPESGETKQELYASMKIEINSKGTFHQIFIFLDRLSKLKRLVGVVSVDLSGAAPTDRTTLKGSTVALSGRKLTGGDRTFRTINAKITLLAYRVI
jgi:Tfp pilus assembly protein PilO